MRYIDIEKEARQAGETGFVPAALNWSKTKKRNIFEGDTTFFISSEELKSLLSAVYASGYQAGIVRYLKRARLKIIKVIQEFLKVTWEYK